jgi:hypothetical protein
MRSNQKLFKTMSASAVAVVLLFSAPTIVRAFTTNLNAGDTINLATLINSNWSAQVGDKEFGAFYFAFTDYGDPTKDLVSSNVNIRALENNIGFGLEFLEPLIAYNNRTCDVSFAYTAAVAAGYDYLISDIHLGITGARGGSGTGTVHEVVCNDYFGGTQVGQVNAYLPSALQDAADIVPAVNELWVSKDVIVSGNGGGPTSYATISIIDQTYSQIPEPSTVLLVGLGLLGAVALKRKT